MTSSVVFILLLAMPMLAFGVPGEQLGFLERPGRPTDTCSYTCSPGKGKAYKACGRGNTQNPGCYLDICYLTTLSGQLHAGYSCYPAYVEPSYGPWPRYTPEPRETTAPVPDVPCPATCRESQTLADDDCTYDGLPIAGCQSDSTCSLAVGSGYQCAPYQGVSETKTFISSLSGLELIVRYQWFAGQYDLDTSTEFLGDKPGSTCSTSSGQYIEFLGDNTSGGGAEVYIIQIGDSLANGAWGGSTTVKLYGHWYASSEKDPFTIFASLRDASTGAPIANSEISISVHATYKYSCPTELLGHITITDLGGSVSLEITPN